MVSCLLGELDVWVSGVDVLQGLVTVLCLLDNKGVIHILKPQPGPMGAELIAPTSNSSMNRLPMMEIIGGPMHAPCTFS